MAYNLGRMSNHNSPALPKWPFFIGDFVLICFAGLIVYQTELPLSLWQTVLVLAAVSLGAWLGVFPFVREHQAALKFSEANALATTVAQIKNLDQIKTQISNATNHWQGIQEQSSQAIAAAREIGDRMRSELDEFCEFLRKANDAEKGNLRLEVEKLRRGETEWLQLVVLLLDHALALHQATLRAGQAGPIAQLNKFQFACTDAARRMGVVPFTPKPGDSFDPEVHQSNSEKLPEGGAQIAEVLAVGFMYQGQLARRALVTTAPDPRAQPELPI
jgi:molecular chaperone GrpE